MSDKNANEFNFDDAELYSDSLFQEEMKDLRVEKLSQRLTVITILIPCLIGVILFIAYRDLTGRVIKSEYSGSKEVANLSKALEEKFNSLSTQDKEIQGAVAQKISALETASASLNENLKKLSDRVSETEKNVLNLAQSKSDKEDQANAIQKINDALVPIRNELDSLDQIRKELKSVSSEIQALDKNLQETLIPLSTQISTLSAKMDKTQSDLSEVQSNLTVMSDAKMGKDEVELELLKVRKIYQRALDEEISKVDSKLETFLRRIKQLERGLKQLADAAQPAAVTTTPKDSGVVEQDLKE